MARCYIASGKIYAKDLSLANQPYLAIGNAQLALAITEEEQTQPDYTNVAGGNACSVKDISSVALTMTMYDFDKKNLALAVFGSAAATAAGSVVNEPIDMFLEGITPLAHMPTTTGVMNVGATVYAPNVDYTIGPGGVTTIAGSALAIAIAATGVGTPKRLAAVIDYDYAIEDVVEALVTSGKTFALMVETKNKADGAKAAIWRFFKVQFGPTGGVNIITREFGSFEVAGEVLADTTQVGVGDSQYFQIQQAV